MLANVANVGLVERGRAGFLFVFRSNGFIQMEKYHTVPQVDFR